MALQTKTLALIIAAVAISAGLAGYFGATQGSSILSVFAASPSTTTTTTSSGTSSNGNGTMCGGGGYWMMNGGNPGFLQGPQFGNQQQVTTIPTGTTITITSTQGEFRVVGDRTENGTASGTLTFTVNSELSHEYVLTLSSGTITVNGSTYTVSSGSAQMSLSANEIQGQGTASSNSSFTIQASAYGNFSGITSASVTLDFKSGSTEYVVLLTGTIQG